MSYLFIINVYITSLFAPFQLFTPKVFIRVLIRSCFYFKKIFEHYTVRNVWKFINKQKMLCIIIFNFYLCILCGAVKFDGTLWV